MINKLLNTPILFLTFNRPIETRLVFEQIKKIKPKRLYIASDGARVDIDDERNIVSQIREKILDDIDWNCDVHTLFRDENLGCKYAVSGAIDWFFENEEQGIILEDDCLPDLSFFKFCEELLEKYKNNEKIMQINGFNPVKCNLDSSYTFSKYGAIWGWASWRRAWKYYDVEMKKWGDVRDNKNYDYFYINKKEKKRREILFEKTFNNQIDTWDYQWLFAKQYRRGLSIFPKNNTITNIGFNNEATHTKKKPTFLPNNEKIKFPLKHPKIIVINNFFDYKYFNNFLKTNLITKILNKLSSIF